MMFDAPASCLSLPASSFQLWPCRGTRYGRLSAGLSLTFAGLRGGRAPPLQHEVAALRPVERKYAGQLPAILAELVEVAANEPGAVFTALPDVLRPFR